MRRSGAAPHPGAMRTLIQVHDPAGFLSLIPTLMGSTPRESVVAVGMRGSRSQGVLRIDLPKDQEGREAVAALIVGTLCRIGDLDALALVLYTGSLWADRARRVDATLAGTVRDCAARAGFGLVGAWRVARDAWGAAWPGSGPGRPLSEIEAVGPLLPPPPPAAEAEGPAPEPSAAAHSLLESVLRRTSPPSFDELAGIGALFDLPRSRDAALLSIAFGHGVLDPILEPGEDGARGGAPSGLAIDAGGDARPGGRDKNETDSDADARVAERLTELLCGRTDARPDPARVDRGIAVIGAVAAEAGSARRAMAHGVLAWLHWAAGRGTQAARHLRLAELDAPHDPFARLLDEMVHTGWLPEWLFPPRKPL